MTGLVDTYVGVLKQVNRAYRGQGKEIARRNAGKLDDCQPKTLEEALRVIEAKNHIIADLRASLVDKKRADHKAVIRSGNTEPKYWDTATMCAKSGCVVSTITRNAKELGGIKLGGKWMFPVGHPYSKKR